MSVQTYANAVKKSVELFICVCKDGLIWVVLLRQIALTTNLVN